MSPVQVFTEDLYAVLGVPPDANEAQIRSTGRQRQRETHPDYGGDATDFMRVRIAIEVMLDPELRAQHDAWLAGSSAARRGGSRLRSQQRASRRPAPPTRGRAPGTAGMRNPPREPEHMSEPPPPDRIPKPRIDLDRMAWARTAWAERPDQWPPARATLPPLSRRERTVVILFGALVLLGVLLFTVPASPAHLALPGPTASERGASLWGLVLCYVVLALGWAVPCVLVRARVLARVVNIAAIVVAGGAGVVFGVLALMRLAIGDGRGALGSFLAFVVCLLTALVSVLMWAELAERARAHLQSVLLVRLAESSAPRVDDPTRVFGSPAQSTMGGAAGISVAVNPMRAVMAQRIVGPALNELLRIPGVRIVHGLRRAGSGPGIVAHAVVAGRRIALIDDELWRPGHYAVGQTGGIRRDGVPYSTAATEFPHVVESYYRLFGEVAFVRGWITILPEREGSIEVDGGVTWERTRLATLESTLREVGDWLAQDGERIDRLLLRDLIQRRV